MLQIDLPDIDSIQLWDEIVSNKRGIRKEKLLQCRGTLLERYDFYQSHYGSLEKITPLEASFWEGIKDDLHSCYGNNVAFSRARKKIFSSAYKCPYCLLNRPNTLDHYFDKSDYPEYSVFIPNLIPCCSECNSLKGTSMFNDGQQRQFIHFYLDNIPDYQYIFVRFIIDSPKTIPQIHVDLKFQENEPLQWQIRNHFSQLDLLRKYQDAIISQLPVVLSEIEIAKNDDMTFDEIQELIRHKYQALTRICKNNYWETCMYEGLLNSEGVLQTFFDFNL